MTLRQSSMRAFCAVVCLALAGCNWAPGRPKPGPEVPRPDAVLDFPTLYRQNCSACHGDSGINGPSYPLANPEYQGLVNESTLRKIIAEGLPGTMMPAFARSAGGDLTDAQVNALVAGMRAAWYKPAIFAGITPPPYQAASAGDVANGAPVYTKFCARCHGSIEQPGGKAGSILDPNFLQLVSNQELRTLVIAGRPDLGQPDWRGYVEGQPMTAQQVSDLIAWLASRRPQQGDMRSAGAEPAKAPAKSNNRSGGDVQ